MLIPSMVNRCTRMIEKNISGDKNYLKVITTLLSHLSKCSC